MPVSSLEKRLAALEERLKPSIPWDVITPHLVRQMQATCLSPEAGGGYIETPPELMQYSEYFLYSTAEEYEARHTKDCGADHVE